MFTLIMAMFLGTLNIAQGENISKGVEITEIMYDPEVSESGGEWLEIYNNTGLPLNITDWILNVGVDDVETLKQREGWGDISQIPTGAYAVISEPASTVSFDDLYGPPSTSIYVAVTGGAISLSNDGEPIILTNSDGSIIYQNFTYPDKATNASLVKKVIVGNEDDPENWVASSVPEGTPGFMGDDQALPVTLSYFEARYVDNVVILRWITESEINNLGFEVYRAESKDGPFKKINPHRIEGAGTTASQHKYEYIDDTAVTGNQYFYYIENIDFSGEKEQSETIQAMSGPFGKEKPRMSRKLSVLSQPVEFQVFQNFPNPFNPETWIPFQLPESADVTVKIYNVFGQVVRTIDVGQKGIGRYLSKDESIHWDGRNQNGELVPSGVYFYQFRAGKFMAMKKMLLVK
jgi:hypothetical protein